MKKTALVIMAAGIGSRFGGGIKQLEPIGPGGEIIMDYSIHDALEAGFDRIVFVMHRFPMHFRNWMIFLPDLRYRRTGKNRGGQGRRCLVSVTS